MHSRARIVAPLRAAAASSCLVLATVAAAAPLKVATLLAAPFPYDMVASPSGDSVAWIENEGGSRNVWVASAPGWAARKLTAFSGDDGYDLESIAWSGDGRWLAFSRGGDEAEPDNEKTNPVSDPAGREQTVWIADLDGNRAPRSVAAGGGPVPSPRGDRMAFVAGGQLWLAPHDGEGKPEQVTKLAGRCSTPRWSPDGAASPSSRTAARTASSGCSIRPRRRCCGSTPRWIPTTSRPGPPTGPRRLPPPSGELRASVLRFAADRRALVDSPRRRPRRHGRELFRADPGDGSAFHPADAEAALWWTAGDRLVFPWERGGWLHLWSIGVSGGKPVELTPGAFEIENVTIAPDRGAMLVSSNQSGPDRRKVWSVSVDGSSPARRITTPPPPSSSSPHRSPRERWRTSNPARASRRARCASPARVRSRRRCAPARCPRTTRAPRWSSPPTSSSRRPTGSPSTVSSSCRRARRRTEGTRRSSSSTAARCARCSPASLHGLLLPRLSDEPGLASRGFVVLSVNYRSGSPTGSASARHRGRRGGRLGVPGRARRRPVSSSRTGGGRRAVGIWGGSYGGYLTALALARASNVFKAGVDLHGVHDWNLQLPVHPSPVITWRPPTGWGRPFAPRRSPTWRPGARRCS